MKKKSIYLLLAGLCLVACLASCSNDDEEESKTSSETKLPPMSDPDDVCTSMKDANFMAYCYKYFDINGDNKVSPTEAAVVKKLDYNLRRVDDMTGIQYFTGLKEIDISYCTFTSLDLTHCPDLEILDFEAPVESIDLSRNSKLSYVWIKGGKFTSINLSHNLELEVLMIDAPLTSLDLSKNARLEVVELRHTAFSSFDFSKYLSLRSISLVSTKMNSIDISSNKELVGLYISDETLPNVDISNNNKLTGLSIICPKMKSIDLSHNPEIVSLSLANSGIEALDIHNLSKMKFFSLEGMEDLKEIRLLLSQRRFLWQSNDNINLIYVDESGNALPYSAKVSYSLTQEFSSLGVFDITMEINAGGAQTSSGVITDMNFEKTVELRSLPATCSYSLNISNAWNNETVDYYWYQLYSLSIRVEIYIGNELYSSRNYYGLKNRPNFYGYYDETSISNFFQEFQNSLINKSITIDAYGNVSADTDGTYYW